LQLDAAARRRIARGAWSGCLCTECLIALQADVDGGDRLASSHGTRTGA